MKRILDTIKKNYIAFTVAIVILLIVVASIITISIINHNRHKIVTKSDTQFLYQYIGTMKNSFSANITYADNQITQITSSRYNIIDSMLYYDQESKAIIPYESELIFYYRDNLTYSLPKYSTLSVEKTLKTLGVEGNEYNTDSFIIYDGEDTYFVPDESILIVDGKKISLSAMSYIVANRATLTYYDYKEDDLITLEGVIVANLKIDNAYIDLFGDAVVYNKKTILIDQDIKKYPVYKED